MINLAHVSYTGPPIDDAEVYDRLPPELAGLLGQVNGFIQFGGGLHVRGACREPAWHSLRDAWLGERAFHRLYPEMGPDDIPFGEDCVGDQFFLRDGEVWQLAAETGDVECVGLSLSEFLISAQADPAEMLGLSPLVQFQEDGGRLGPGQLLAAYPPFCTKQAADGVTLAAVSTEERRRFLANLADFLRGVPDGGTFDFKVVD